MADLRNGKQEAASRLVERFYPELRKIASARMKNERSDHTWQPTALVNELYLQLTRIHALPPSSPEDENEKKAFLGLAAYLMRQLLIHHARPLYRRAGKTEVSEDLQQAVSGEESLVEIDEVLDRLSRIDPVLREVVELKVFEGLSREDIAKRLGCSLRTVARHWEFAREWLREALVPAR